MVDVRYDTAFKLYPYEKVAAQNAPPVRHPVIIVGGGPVGMAMALDLGNRNIPVLVLDDHDGVGLGSRAICFSKRTLEIADRLGFGEALVDKGVVWNVGKVFHGDGQVFQFDLQPEDGHKNPAFINLQQPYFEKFAVEAVREAQENGAPIEIRGCNQVIDISRNYNNNGEYVTLEVDTPDGPYKLEADWLIACDGARSPTRKMLNLDFDGRVFEDNFLIADVKMKADFPTERWFWFEPQFEGAGQSALLHKQPDDIWRIDFQLGWDIDRKAELDPTKIRSRVDAMLSSQTGNVPKYELEWTSIYTFQCRRMETFNHGPVIFAGDAAHQVSPFGARGANSGIQDIDNLGWKLELIFNGLAPKSLIETYSEERVYGADENILNSTRSTDFMTPKSDVSKIFRNAVLDLAKKHEFSRPMVNSGRLSLPCVYKYLSLNSADKLNGPARSRVGSICPDTPIQTPQGKKFLLNFLSNGFTILAINTNVPKTLNVEGIIASSLALATKDDPTGMLAERYLGEEETAVYLIRPDQCIAARWPMYDETQMRAAINIATGRE